MANLLETYKDRLVIAEKVYQKSHLGEAMSSHKKLTVAKCLENVNKFMNESFANSTGTQRSDMGNFKRFTMNLTNVAIPNLIAFDLVIVHPMSSMTGYVAYYTYVAGSNKGETQQGDQFNSPFGLGKVDPNYTSDRVVESVTLETTATEAKLAWFPILPGLNNANIKVTKLADGSDITSTISAVDAATGTLTFSAAPGGDIKVAYVYDNIVIPQNDIAVLNARVENIPLLAKARRIAVYYSQIAAFQSKTDYGVDLGEQLAEKAVGQLNYEIDTEITQLLINSAPSDGDLVWSKTLPMGVSKAEHYEGFVEIIEQAGQKVYDRTQRFSPNYILVSRSLINVLVFIKGFQAAPAGKINGPYFAGTINGLKVFVTPNIGEGEFVVGVNGDDMMSSAAVYAPYMPIVPTQLLGYADGSMSQGFSTMYDLKILNADLLVKGRITA